MEVTFDASALVEAGRLVGAEGLVFVKAGCARWTRKSLQGDLVSLECECGGCHQMTDTTLFGTLCWSMHR